MIKPRRLSLQLTPLLDMLLILMFVQYLEMREAEVVIDKKAGSAVSDLAEVRAKLLELLSREEALQSAVEAERSLRSATEGRLVLEQHRLSKSQQDLDNSIERERVISSLVTEMFQIPTEEFDRLLKSAQMPSVEQSPAEMARVKERFRQLSQQSSGRVIEHLLSYDEIRKRCDVWELYVDAQGVATITAGERTKRIRIPTLANEDIDIAAFVDEIYFWYRSLPQPKSLVVILLTYDRASRIVVTESVRRALPLLIARMQADHLGQTRFEYADLGFKLD